MASLSTNSTKAYLFTSLTPNAPFVCRLSQFVETGVVGGHVEYCVTFGFSETNQRCVWKRFSEFEVLYKDLCKMHEVCRAHKAPGEFPFLY